MNYDGQKVCGVPDTVGAAGNCLWPHPDVRVFVSAFAIPGIDVRATVQAALDGWNGVCGIALQLTDDPQRANIVIDLGRVDGPSGTLAWSELPCGIDPRNPRRLRLLLDASEAWVVAANPPANKIDLLRVLKHEIGHAIGISHIAAGNLMAPTYSAAIADPQRGDVMEAVVRYGKKNPAAETPVTPPATASPLPTPRGRLARFLKLAKDLFDLWQTLSPTDWAGLEDE